MSQILHSTIVGLLPDPSGHQGQTKLIEIKAENVVHSKYPILSISPLLVEMVKIILLACLTHFKSHFSVLINVLITSVCTHLLST